MYKPALLALADGSIFEGVSIGAAGVSTGEVVFNTSMSGYQEILTDPSYQRQLVTLTYPHIGNVGTNDSDTESDRIQASGLIVREPPREPSNWRSEQSLPDYLDRRGCVAIADIDTRRLTRILREKGAQDGCIMAGDTDADAALQKAREFPGLNGMDLARGASTTESYEWGHDVWQLAGPANKPTSPARHVVVYDYGVKRNILRMLVHRGCRVTVLPAETPLSEALEYKPDGVVLSNGPGDPQPCDYAIKTAGELIESGMPTFGICLGHQLLGLASGANGIKLKHGHHGANHPVEAVDTGQVLISSQNHGFALDEASLPDFMRTTHRSLFDGTLQGVECKDRPVMTFQGHPEASPGPQDVQPLFDRFFKLMEASSLQPAGG